MPDRPEWNPHWLDKPVAVEEKTVVETPVKPAVVKKPRAKKIKQ